ncbi:MAG: hypothetical protein COT91_00435 [Candidatus Doudnabacteria bacterium CG10_big_fil_rev_8_21_14_0_10_41_10]|uniref:Uncharacterized protein n=1 Tax=Candidatus Doudnabacteria bacterium CG10_big_fil_rev_8_21_14_0_10_41_10 TaxID=1974551 RepID=A0A2H0VET2_9BACT|nr:MAG: hypothetical protein COT91_00435 [Candidatus Doudnabacteria bacterium CG10_big_fil_rev_8_21_14_0_10_41_10]
MKSQNKFFEKKLKLLSERGKILDVGSGKPWQKEMAQYKDWFKNTTYETLDTDPQSQATHIADVQKIPLPDESYDAIICKAVLQHVPFPYNAIQQMHRVLKPGGLLLVYVPFIYPYHAKKNLYKDYWRFSKDGIERLFRDFQGLEISPVDGYFTTMLNFFPVSILRKTFKPITILVDKLFQTKKRSSVSGYYIFAKK